MTTPATAAPATATSNVGAAPGGTTTGNAGTVGTDGKGAQGAPAGQSTAGGAQGAQGTPANGAGTTPAEGQGKPATPPADDYKLTVPEGVEAGSFVDSFKAVAKESGLKSEAAQKVLDFLVKTQGEAVQKAEAHRTQQLEEWVKAAKTDKEFGGEKFDANLAKAKAAIERHDKSGGFRALLRDSGLGNHPEAIRFALSIAQSIADDSVAGTTATGATEADGEKAFLAAMYPTMHQTK